MLRLTYSDIDQISDFFGMGAGIQRNQRKGLQRDTGKVLGVVHRFIILLVGTNLSNCVL